MSELIRYVVALDCEARPLLEHYRMTRDRRARGFTVYQNDSGCALVVTGVGRVAAAAGAAYLYGRIGLDEPAAWINVGIGGHPTASPGAIFLAHQIRLAADSSVWYPPLTIDTRGPSCTVLTVDKPESIYALDALYDMEAGGFYPTVSRFVTSELAQVIKVVSDNRQTPATRDRQMVSRLIKDQLPLVVDTASQTAALAAQLRELEQPPAHWEYWLAKYRFSETQTLQLRDRLRRLERLSEHSPSGWRLPEKNQFQSSKELLAWMDRELRRF